MREGNENAGHWMMARQVLLSLCRQCQLLASKRLDGGQDPQGLCLSYRLRPAVDAEFAIDIAGV
jgi:hypothetical protein